MRSAGMIHSNLVEFVLLPANLEDLLCFLVVEEGALPSREGAVGIRGQQDVATTILDRRIQRLPCPLLGLLGRVVFAADVLVGLARPSHLIAMVDPDGAFFGNHPQAETKPTFQHRRQYQGARAVRGGFVQEADVVPEEFAKGGERVISLPTTELGDLNGRHEEGSAGKLRWKEKRASADFRHTEVPPPFSF